MRILNAVAITGGVALVGSFYFVGSADAGKGPAPKANICHFDGDTETFSLINISSNALNAHLDNHGDVYPGAWYVDGDGDGFGAGGSDAVSCPGAGLIDNNGDTDDADASVNPNAPEVCGDGIDNDSDGSIDEDCAPTSNCPVYGGTDCYWLGFNGSVGEWCWEPATWASSESQCKNLDSCSQSGGGASGGGCYKWSPSSEGPWSWN